MGKAIADTLMNPHHLIVDTTVCFSGAVADSCHSRAARNNALVKIQQ